MADNPNNRLLIPNTCQVPNVLLEKVIPRLSSGAVRVLLVIIRFTYGYGRLSDKISYSQLAKESRLSRRQVIEGVKELGDLIKIVPGAKGRGANEYSLNVNVSNGQLLSGEGNFTSEENRTSEVFGTGVVKKTAPSQTHLPKPNKDTPESDKPILDSHSSPIKRNRKPAGVVDPAQERGFARWYEAYPRKVGRKAAHKAWMKLNPDPALAETIMAATARYAQNTIDVEPAYIAHPGSWLNGERWEDEPPRSNGAARTNRPQRGLGEIPLP